MRDYTGKTVFVGIDVHKKTYAITCICEKQVIKRTTLKAEHQILSTFLHKHFVGAKIITAYEAGFSGFVLHRHLLKENIENKVIHAASVEISARDRVKTDKRDSLKIATQLSDGRLKAIHVPTLEREAYREVTRLRDKIAQDKRREGNRIKSLLTRHGFLGPSDEEIVSEKWLKKIELYNYDPSIKYCVDIMIAKWRFLQTKLQEMEKKLAEQAKVDEKLEKIYQSVPGIGPLHARILANELGDMEQFSSEKKLFSFTGLTPCEYSSGEHKRLGHISRQGRPILRKVLIQAAWVAVKQDPSLNKIFENMATRTGKKRAIVGIARRLIGRIRHCLRKETTYYYNLKTDGDSKLEKAA